MGIHLARQKSRILAGLENPDTQMRMVSYPVRVDLRLTVEEGKAIDEWRRQQPDLPTRQEAVRRIIDEKLGVTRKNAGDE